MLKKDSQVKWMEEAIKSFNLVKLALSLAPVLVNPNYTQDFILFSFSSEHTMAAVLLQKRDDHERPIAFFNRAIRYAALKYNIIEKQALALVKALKDFRISYMLSPPPGMTRNKVRTLKLKAAKFCILNSALYWKDPGGVLLNFLVEKEEKKVMEDFHEGDCDGHLFWKSTTNKILRAGYYWPTLFADVYKVVKSCHKCQIFEGRWILTARNYFMKWIEAIPTRQATNAVIFSFLENSILSHFGCSNKLITDNLAAFKSKRMVEFFHKYHIILGHSTTYHLQGNRLVESSNKSLVNIIKKLLEINKKSWHKRLVNALWADQVSQKKSIGTSPFELLYGVDTMFLTSIAAPVIKLLQEAGSEDDPMQRRLNQMVHLQQTREEVF
eukprot:PITA_32339